MQLKVNLHHPGGVSADVILTLNLFPGKMLSGEEEGLEDDAERTEVTTGSFTGEMLLPKDRID